MGECGIMKNLYDRFVDRYPQIMLNGNFPKGGFILKHGAVITAYGNHNAMVNAVGGTLKGLILTGVIRYHMNRDVIGIDLPSYHRIERAPDQLRILKRVIKHHNPAIIIMSQVGRKYAVTLGANGERWTNAHITRVANGGNIK